MKNLFIALIVTLLAILNVACVDSKNEQAEVVVVDTVKMFNDAIANKDSKSALVAIELDVKNDGEAIHKCKKDTIAKMSKFIDSDDYVVTYEALNAQCAFATM
ncbi:hypothetical protein AB9_166 [Acinetobacter phage vB_AbaM_B9]|nr:hypothetical protein AB9_010 [Acinetobacter phage vB_AbaM_B9]AWD93283.1 hypothetical protein AB9_166 [Acinetobacter phage vB_AbaM_B9]